MTTYNVHLYPLFRATYKGIEASTPQEAFDKARALFETGDEGTGLSFADSYDGGEIDPILPNGEIDYDHVHHII